MVSTKQRIKLTTRNIEMLVFLQRAMTNEDVHTLTAEDFRAQRRRVLEVKRAKEREDVLTDISRRLLEGLISQDTATEERVNAANVVAERWPTLTDEQVDLQGEGAFTAADISNDNLVKVEDVLAELFPEYECEDIEDELLDVEVEGRPLTAGRLARMSAAER